MHIPSIPSRIVENRFIGPRFIDGYLNGDKYMDLLNNVIISAFQQNGQLPQDVWFQQDLPTTIDGLEIYWMRK